ncbi:MAG: MFS transporter, partial [Oleibacter sp.]|nr:MFS transporter [Thalassolituus sp.]
MLINSRMVVGVMFVLLVALTLRIGFTSVSPLQGLIQQDMGSLYWQLGLLATLPQFASGIFSFLMPWLLERFQPERIVILGLLLIGSLSAVTVVGDTHIALFAVMTIVGSGMALTQTSLQSVIKKRYPKYSFRLSSAMVAGMHAGSAIAALTTLGLAMSLGSWRYSVLCFGVFALLVCLFWALVFLR